jgi:tRNA dimethylallyltransferase
VGKTSFSLSLATHYGCPVLSADSRQFYRGLTIGTAAPDAADLARATHYFTGFLPIDATYSAGLYEADVLRVLSERNSDPLAILCGGSMLYIDAVCRGIDDIPAVDPQVRKSLNARYEEEGIACLLSELRERDPVYYRKVDHKNCKRVLHALEVCMSTGRAFSSFHTGCSKPRPFRIRKFGLTLPREALYERINRRVDRMMSEGLLDEARHFYPYRRCNALRTVGYKELFQYFDGELSLPEAVDRIKGNTRRYARQQMTWFKRDPEVTWLTATDSYILQEVIAEKNLR